MKRIIHFLFLNAVVLAVAACGALTTTTPSNGSSTGTTGTVSVVLQEELTRIKNLIPISTNADVTLPLPAVSGVTVTYSADGTPLSGNVLPYDYPSADHAVELSIVLFLGDEVYSGVCTILMVYDAELYADHQVDLAFQLVDERLRAGIPEAVKSDFTLPTVPDEGVEVAYAPSRSYIYDGRLIFDFPISDTEVELEAEITVGNETRTFLYEVVMKGLASLQRINEIYIETQDHAPIVSKDDYVPATFSMVTYDENNVATELMTAKSIGIRGRGNSTFYMPKMPYRIKFAEKTALMGGYAEKSWNLLANYADQTLIRNYLAYGFASDIGMTFAPGAMFADVYLNGEYIGNYMITDQVEVTTNRVNVQKGSTDTDTGFLVEMDQKIIDYPEGVEGLDWFVVEGYHFMVKEPASDEDYRTPAQFAYIEDYFGVLFATLRDGEDYSALIDVDTFVDWFIVNEVFKNVDSGYSSVYYYKNVGGVLKMGPVWDFDLSAGNQQNELVWELRQPTGWYTARWDKNRIFYYLFEYESFRDALKARWIELYDAGVIPGLLGKIYPTADALTYSRYQNFRRWDVIGKNNEWYTNPEVFAADSYPKQLELLYDYLQTRIAWLDDYVRGLN